MKSTVLMFGVLLATVALPAGVSAGEAVELTLGKGFYLKGEPITVTIKNISGGTAEPFIHVMNPDDTYDEDEPKTLAPGETITWTYDYNRTDQRLGTYYINVNCVINGDTEHHTNDGIEFDVVRRSNGRIVVNTTKNRYFIGEELKFFVVARPDVSVHLPCANPYTIARAGRDTWETVYTPDCRTGVPLPLEVSGNRTLWTLSQTRFSSGQPASSLVGSNLRVNLQLLTDSGARTFQRRFTVIRRNS